MRVTKWGEYGILCSLFLTHKYKLGCSAGASEIAKSQDIPLQYTQQILQRLRKGDVIESIRGPLGGYKLARAPEDISIKDVLYAAEGNTFEVMCETNPVCGINGDRADCCGLRDVWRDLKATIDDVLAKKTLASVFENHDLSLQFDDKSELVGIAQSKETS
ncbi:Rrf2 family transcriptional regulator [Oligoflexia bacterium]|nr:Rrf2 family transcriptional regulator [Oligoflexia bacterium]